MHVVVMVHALFIIGILMIVLVSVPLYLLYEVSIIVVGWAG